MKPQTGAKIFPAADRGLHEQNWFRSYYTFSFGDYKHQHKKQFGRLYALNDDTLAGGCCLTYTVQQDSEVMLIPVVGAISYRDSCGNSTVVEAGELQVCRTAAGTTIDISNPYETELVNFIQVWISAPCINEIKPPQQTSFNPDKNKNALIDLFSASGHMEETMVASYKTFIGKFDGRKEGSLTPANAWHGLFAYVIEGAFEVQNRLMESRDGLALWDVEELEFEALSNNAIILVLEIPFPKLEHPHCHL